MCHVLSCAAVAADGFKNNRYSLEDWSINNQSVALLSPLANASQYLEGKSYPTSNLVIPSMHESTVDPKAAGFRKHGEMAWGEILLAHRWNVSSYHEPRLREEM